MELPGDRIRAMRKKAGHSLRDLAHMCDPPMDYTAIGRIERNMGYTSATLKRIAVSLGCTVSDFFLPDELAEFTELPQDLREDVARHVQNLAIAARHRTA